MKFFRSASILLPLFAAPVWAQSPAEDSAALFGAREVIGHASLSPDGTKIAFIGPDDANGTILYTFDTAKAGAPRAALRSTGENESVTGCDWVSNDRLACRILRTTAADNEIYNSTIMISLNADGSDVKSLSKSIGKNVVFDRNVSFDGGRIIDRGNGSDGKILMSRSYFPESDVGSLIEKRAEGLGVDQIDTRTLGTKRIEAPKIDASEYITDGNGTVRIMGNSKPNANGFTKGIISYLFRLKDSRDWKPLGDLDYAKDTGFNPYTVDAGKNLVYGFSKVGGRKALVSISLAGDGLAQSVVLARPDVDVDGLIQIGRQRRVVGASFATDRRQSVYFDPELKKLAAALGRALPKQPLVDFVDSSADETKLLIWAGGDTSPGTYYLFDRTAKKLQPILPVRPGLEAKTLAPVNAVTYPAADGTLIPAYLTVPPGSSGKNLPTIVIPHGGPSARDEWGFDWLSQYYVSRGFAVLQPNFRGSSGYGDTWYQQNGFKSWKSSIGDVNDAGRWLAKTGVADASRLFIVGWSYGGYAALQSAVLDPGLFKAVVAIAPVTDLEMTKGESRNFDNHRVQEGFIGSGSHIKEGSPAQNADRIAVPVLMFHGELDSNVRIAQSRFMAKQLRQVGKRVELIEYPKLEHSLVDSRVRADMLRRSADFLLASVAAK